MSITGVAPPVEVILFVVPDTLVTVPVVGATHEGIPAARVKTNPFVVAANFDKMLAALA